jgi:excisionase family DNA binding protein
MNTTIPPVHGRVDLSTRLVSATEAAFALNLPLYYLTNASKRRNLELPHYRVGKLVRFKLDELQAWQAARAERTAGQSGGGHAGL